VATPEATFAITPAKLGVPYNLGGLLTVMNMIPLPVAKEMLFTAQPIPVSQALNLGVVNYVKPAMKSNPSSMASPKHRRQFAAEHLGHEGGVAAAVERALDHAGTVRTDPGTAADGVRQPGLSGRPELLPGKTQAPVPGQLDPAAKQAASTRSVAAARPPNLLPTGSRGKGHELTRFFATASTGSQSV
jgi:enoyl-CoA hydratase/carnithine racemase